MTYFFMIRLYYAYMILILIMYLHIPLDAGKDQKVNTNLQSIKIKM